ncbi:aspartate/glutamate racemase family protein [Roseibium algae]|uniref:Aspartate racemase n=1 Tax=Roseibium algae TaxID=3123038 RepID=A0ABU8TMP1_9HYPH
MKTIGMLGGMSWESTQTYYQMLNRMAREKLGGLHSAQLLLWSFDFAEIEACQAAGDWDRARALMIQAARRVELGGAASLVYPAAPPEPCRNTDWQPTTLSGDARAVCMSAE